MTNANDNNMASDNALAGLERSCSVGTYKDGFLLAVSLSSWLIVGWGFGFEILCSINLGLASIVVVG
jgi:hypothetical protein